MAKTTPADWDSFIEKTSEECGDFTARDCAFLRAQPELSGLSPVEILARVQNWEQPGNRKTVVFRDVPFNSE